MEGLRRMLHDADTSVRVEAVKGLSEVGTQASLDPLIEASRDNDSEVQIRAAAGLVNFYLPGYIQSRFDRLGTALKSKFTEQPDQVIPAYVTVREDVIAALGSLVKGGSSMESRASAARAVGILRGKSAIPALIDALHSKDGDVLYESLSAIQKIRGTSVGPRIAFLLDDHEDKVQIAALETVGLLRSQETLPDVRKALERARNEKVRRTALFSVALMPELADRTLFDRYRTNKDENLRAAAAEGYGRLQNPADLPSLHKDFDDETKMKPRLAEPFSAIRLRPPQTHQFSPLPPLFHTPNYNPTKRTT